MSPSDRPLFGRLVGRFVIIFLKSGKLHFHAPIRALVYIDSLTYVMRTKRRASSARDIRKVSARDVNS